MGRTDNILKIIACNPCSQFFVGKTVGFLLSISWTWLERQLALVESETLALWCWERRLVYLSLSSLPAKWDVEWDVLWVPFKLYRNCKKLIKLTLHACLWRFFETDDGEKSKQNSGGRKPKKWRTCRTMRGRLIVAGSLALLPPSVSDNFLHDTLNDLTPRGKSGCGLKRKRVNFTCWECQV